MTIKKNEEVIPVIEVKNKVTTTETLGINPKKKVVTAEETESKADESIPTISAVPLAKGENLVKICPNFTDSVYIGVKNYHFVKGECVNVPKHVKDILFEQGGLAPM